MGGKASAASKNKWNAKAYDRINLVIPKGRRATLEACAAARGESVNGMINDVLRNACGMDAATWRQRPDGEGDSAGGEA